jgi:hypothetical protein
VIPRSEINHQLVVLCIWLLSVVGFQDFSLPVPGEWFYSEACACFFREVALVGFGILVSLNLKLFHTMIQTMRLAKEQSDLQCSYSESEGTYSPGLACPVVGTGGQGNAASPATRRQFNHHRLCHSPFLLREGPAGPTTLAAAHTRRGPAQSLGSPSGLLLTPIVP